MIVIILFSTDFHSAYYFRYKHFSS